MAYTFAVGDGTQANPYKVSTLDDLNGVRDYLSAYFEMTNDIDASDTINWDSGAGWLPIGSVIAPFTGSFDGKGHKILGLYINRPATDNVGLFGAAQVIKNTGIEGCIIKGRKNVGGLIGLLLPKGRDIVQVGLTVSISYDPI